MCIPKKRGIHKNTPKTLNPLKYKGYKCVYVGIHKIPDNKKPADMEPTSVNRW